MNQLVIFSAFLSTFCFAFAQHSFPADRCPAAETIKPCTCYKNSLEEDVAECRGLKSHDDIRVIFDRVPGWKFTILYIFDSAMLYIPSSIFENSTIGHINVTGSRLVSLFDVAPKTNALRHIFIEGSILQRGFRWDLVSGLDLESVVLQHTPLRVLGTSFKNNIPQDVKYLWFEGNALSRLLKQPFEHLKKLEILAIKNQPLKNLKSLKLPQSLRHLELGSNSLQTLPDGFFSGLPNLSIVLLNNNQFTTVKEETFIGIKFLFMDDNPLDCTCFMKWIVFKKNPMGFVRGTCLSPSNLKGKELTRLTESDFDYCG